MPAANTSCDPVPVPVVNEVADAIAQALVDTRDENVAMWKDSEILKDVVAYLTEAVCESPQVRAAFEAQAKLEAAKALLRRAPEAIGWTGRDTEYGARSADTRQAIEKFLVEEGGES